MIPLHIPAENPSRAEHRLFRTFESDCPADWIVVLIPGHGIVCVEAKTYLARTTDGSWRFTACGPPSDKSPFKQANNAKYRIIEWLSEHNMPDMLGVSAVVHLAAARATR